MVQNIYDHPDFFEGYKHLRENACSANRLIEQPALFALLPDLSNKTVLDLGCGWGENCKEFVSRGAKKIVGIDCSQNMLEMAKKENPFDSVEFFRLPMEYVVALPYHFDVVVSSLAVHYVEDFSRLAKDIFQLLQPGGIFLFSQEHPLTTAILDKNPCWEQNNSQEVIGYRLSGYGMTGERKVDWLVDDVVKYHRSFSDIFSVLLEAGFSIQAVKEPLPSQQIIEQYPRYRKCFHKPDFLLIKCQKPF